MIAWSLTGCSGVNRLVALSREKTAQSALEEQAHRQYQNIKAHLPSVVGMNKTAVQKLYGDPALAMLSRDGTPVLIYRDSFSWCSQKIYLYNSSEGTIAKYEIVQPCQNK